MKLAGPNRKVFFKKHLLKMMLLFFRVLSQLITGFLPVTAFDSIYPHTEVFPFQCTRLAGKGLWAPDKPACRWLTGCNLWLTC